MLVYGDTNSTLAGALAAAQGGFGLIHIEAGMRSRFDPRMPEERNRVLTDHLADLLLCASQNAATNLQGEAVLGRIEVVGDVMVDVALGWRSTGKETEETLRRLGVSKGSYLLLTAHRSGNVRRSGASEGLGRARAGASWRDPDPAAPSDACTVAGCGPARSNWGRSRECTCSSRSQYLEFGALLREASAVLTDSGGVQKEAYLARVPCITLRSGTEWTETVSTGWNTLVDLDVDATLQALDQSPSAEHPSLSAMGARPGGVAAVEAFLATLRWYLWQLRPRLSGGSHPSLSLQSQRS